MRIISDFHDYYDSALSYGVDTSLLFLRKEKQVEYRDTKDLVKDCPEAVSNLGYAEMLLHRIPDEIPLPKKCFSRYFSLTPTVIGFCGRYIPSFKMHLGDSFESETITFYTPDSLATLIPQKYLDYQRLTREELDEILSRKVEFNSWKKVLTYRYWADVQQDNLVTTQHDNPFIGMKTPIFRMERASRGSYRLTINPCLKDSQFQKIKHPQQCFQEISMYLGNQLAVQNDPPAVISDNTMRDKKGFDEWSFRRHKTESKKAK